ncbi:hypothetical protein FVA74_09395 [Salinibacterium sp. dk2585]|uniref:LmeA family phospholipid-binding protein n=1 Tax=unclassified Salinibacterium TaxID=2632331 RepID=UPI0011C24600|nr:MULTISPECIES: LmeA family phospholipid-binding protein [unclassified Salinibacterium]QEE61762.1 hypothetical protein FVA74_09395 [Salinibacterium sp. dk2585]TXK54683.1 hypothetical protein FVP63_06565 [Salinibacterium sp. dk5596]
MARRPVDPRNPKPSVGRRILKAIIGLTVAAAMLAGAFVLIDMGLRDFAETRAEAEIKRRVPGKSVGADVTINGFSMLMQVARGELDDVDVTFTLGSEGLDRLAENAGYTGDVTIADGAIAVGSEIEVLGTVIPFSVALEPTLDETGHLVLTAVGVTAGDAVDIDLSQFVDLATAGVKVCSASLLPESIRLTGVTVSDGALEFTAHGSGVPTDLDALSTRGECVTEDAAEGEAPAE